MTAERIEVFEASPDAGSGWRSLDAVLRQSVPGCCVVGRQREIETDAVVGTAIVRRVQVCIGVAFVKAFRHVADRCASTKFATRGRGEKRTGGEHRHDQVDAMRVRQSDIGLCEFDQFGICHTGSRGLTHGKSPRKRAVIRDQTPIIPPSADAGSSWRRGRLKTAGSY